ncbi:MAG: ATP-binding protein, partial [Paracoccus sp. (in: a-proteobacteria)]|nr:ATP-binding protein [Paracoccus sp. (in: a-proteobacteria)]
MTNRTELAILGLIAALLPAVLVADLIYPLGTAVWLLYAMPLGLTFALRFPLLPPLMACIIWLLLVVGYFLSDPGVATRLAIANRVMAGVVFAAMGVMGAALIANRRQIARSAWINKGQIGISHAIQGELSPERLAAKAIETLSELIDARAAVAYARDGRGFRRLASWGTDGQALPERIAEDTGHIARAAKTATSLRIDLAPDEALGWSSGLARGRTAATLLVPLRDGQMVNGVLEFGLPQPASDTQVELLDRVADKLGIALRSAQYREQLHELLEETRRQAEELRSHGEELAAANEELEEQTRALQDSQSRLETQQAELENQNSQLEEQRDALARARRLLEEQSEALARESRYKSEFVANMSHELRTTLNALLIMSRLLAENRGGTLSDEQVRWAEAIQASGQDLLALINDILDLSKIEAGKVELSRDNVDANHVAHRITRAFEAQARQKGLELTAEVQPDLPVIVTDAQRLEQVLRNFVSNALKFTARGRVTLRVSRHPQGIAFAVQDTGIGIPPEQQEAVFEAFRQADGTISRRFGGTGLGLSISRELADLLEARLTLESQPGQGSTFTLILPDRRPEESPPVPPRDPVQAPSAHGAGAVIARPAGFDGPALIDDDRDIIREGERVMLVVEDDPAFARILCDLSRELGFRCVCVAEADHAVAAARHYLPQAIVLDIGLPDHSGLSVLDRLKRDISTRHIPVHVVSGEDYTRQALSQGAISYMMKPVQREELSRILQNLGTRLEQRMRRVLIVEDDPAQMEGLKALLANDEIETVGAGTVAEALKICRAQTVDCIV